MVKSIFNKAFRTILDQSTDLVFMVSTYYPHPIVYGNHVFQKEIGESLQDTSLKGLGIDGGALCLDEEFILQYADRYYSFLLERDEEEQVILFHRGIQITPSSQQFPFDTDELNAGSVSERGFLLNLINSTPCALFQMSLDEQGKINFNYLSDRVKKMFKLDPYENEITSIDYLLSKVHPMDVGRVLKSIVYSSRSQVPWECEFRMQVGKNSEPVWLMGRAHVEEIGGEIAWYGCFMDINDFKCKSLELEASKRAAEVSSKTKSDFISTIIHEIRTPLNAISGSVFSLFEEEHTPSQKPLLKTIDFAVENLIIMVNDLLDFQKTEAGKIVLDNKPFNLKELLQQITRGLRFQAIESKNDLNLIVSDRLNVEVIGDKLRVAQVLNNLITNGLKFTNEGKVDVTATMTQDSEDKIRVYFEVKDTGIGIAREDFRKVFNEFEQVNHSFDVKYGGTGLGMPITKKLLELMGSEIQLESEVGKGSTFFFELTFEKRALGGPVISEGNPTARKSFSSLPPNLKILLAEDNDVNAIVIQKIIRRWGLQCERVKNGQEAVEAAFMKSYDVILMDIQMPVMDGCVAARNIKSHISVPIIALTAATMEECCEKNDMRYFDRIVAKPIDAKELHKNMHELILDYIS